MKMLLLNNWLIFNWFNWLPLTCHYSYLWYMFIVCNIYYEIYDGRLVLSWSPCHGGTGWKQDEVWMCSFQGLCLAVLKAYYFHTPCDYFSVHFCVCFSMILVFIFTTFCANFYIIYSIWNKSLVCNVICFYFIFFTNFITFNY